MPACRVQAVAGAHHEAAARVACGEGAQLAQLRTQVAKAVNRFLKCCDKEGGDFRGSAKQQEAAAVAAASTRHP